MGHIARPPVSPKRRGILAVWSRGVGLRADPARKGAGYPPLSPDYDRPVDRPSWPGLARRPALSTV